MKAAIIIGVLILFLIIAVFLGLLVAGADERKRVNISQNSEDDTI